MLTFMVRSSFRGPPRLSSPPPDLSDATLYQKAELEARVAELEAELAAVRMAYSTAADTAALDKKAHNAQLSTLNRQIYAVSCSHVCVHTLLWRHSRVRIYS